MTVYTNFTHWNLVSLRVNLHSSIDTVGVVIETKCSLNKEQFSAMKDAANKYVSKFFDSSISECQFNGWYGHGISFPYLPIKLVKGVNDDHHLYRLLDEVFTAHDNCK